MPDLCETFRWQAGQVWNRMAKAASVRMALSEDTITETALYEMALARLGDNTIVITLATKPQEHRHGGDWEWWLIAGSIGISFRVQAKRLFPNGRYQSLLKPAPHRYQQLDTLRAAARRDGHAPLYSFFNFDHSTATFNRWDGHCRHSYHMPSFWGCTLAAPSGVRAAGSDRLHDLLPYMRPWHKLVCDLVSVRLPDAAKRFVQQLNGLTLAGQSREGATVDPVEERPVPDHILRLASTGRERPTEDDGRFVDEAYWEAGQACPTMLPESLCLMIAGKRRLEPG
jgi:hypothetical protein